ncbi:MAG TPA: hypothetical protein VGD83_30085 [Streptosporangiaceae bacterium]
MEPGSAHDVTAARIHARPALYLAAAADLPTLADPGYDGAGIGILIPVPKQLLVCAEEYGFLPTVLRSF